MNTETLKPIIGGIVRHLLGIIGTAVGVEGLQSEQYTAAITGAVIAVGTIAWSIWQKKKAAK